MAMPTSLDLDQHIACRALQRVVQGQIVSVDGDLRHRSDTLPPNALSALHVLHRHGYITVKPAIAGPPVAELSVSGTQLLDWWNRHPAPEPQVPHDQLASAVPAADVEVCPNGPAS